MIQRIARKMRRLDGQEGFTLIELMVVVLIIGILIAIAVPTFLGARTRAQNKAAESSLRNALTAAKTAFTDNDNYSSATQANLTSIEPSLVWTTGSTGTSDSNTISFAVGAPTGAPANSMFTAAAYSASGTCFYIQDVSASGGTGAGNTPGTWYAKGSAGTSGCSAADSVTWSQTPSAAGW